MAKVALLIGVGEYGNGLSSLTAAPKDVEAIHEVLENPAIGGFDQVTPLINPERQAMEEAIYTLFANRKKDDLLLLFFSGHGVKDDSGNLYLAAHNTRKEQEALVQPTAVAASYVQNIMSSSRSKRQVVILDCCFSGAFAQGMTAKDDGSVPVKQQLGGEGRAVLTSSTSTQYSFESQRFDLSVYTHFLVEGIKTGIADKDQDGAVSIDELHEYASEKVQETAPGKMKPEIYPIREGSKILLAKVRVEDPKLKYRQDVEDRLKDSNIPPIARKLLDLKRDSLQLTPEEAAVIETEVLKPYREYEAKLQQYEQVLSEAIQAENPISKYTRNQLKDYQKFWGLKDKDVALIEARITPNRESINSNENAFSTEAFSFIGNNIDIPNSVISDIQGKPKIQSISTESLIDDFSATLTTDCSQLQDLLVAGKWREADQKTRAIMLKLSGREQEGKLQAEDCRQLSCESLSEIDQLWVKYSNGRFGFSVQQRIWGSLEGSKSSGYDTFKSFGDRVGWSLEGNWRSQDNLIFSLNAVDGHLPYCREWLNWGYSNKVVNRFSALISRLEECGIKPAIVGTKPDIKLESPDATISYPQQLDYSQLSVSQPQSNFTKVSQHKNKLYIVAAFLLFGFMGYSIYQSLDNLEKPSISKLDKQLSAKNWRDADKITSDIIRQLSGTQAGYITSINSNNIQCGYLTKINNLWEHSSRNFGFQKQRNIWEKVKPNQSEFEKKIDWYRKTNSDLIFNETAPVGHLPSAGKMFKNKEDYTNKLEECFKAQK
ncbi:caspase, EACC1-associated type [Nostoc sp.]|uniref:caspase, EACC1-associated type n=1 Tax=Nostoc sp. TaxID=1180 RepID=UPI002FF98668